MTVLPSAGCLVTGMISCSPNTLNEYGKIFVFF